MWVLGEPRAALFSGRPSRTGTPSASRGAATCWGRTASIAVTAAAGGRSRSAGARPPLLPPSRAPAAAVTGSRISPRRSGSAAAARPRWRVPPRPRRESPATMAGAGGAGRRGADPAATTSARPLPLDRPLDDREYSLYPDSQDRSRSGSRPREERAAVGEREDQDQQRLEARLGRIRHKVLVLSGQGRGGQEHRGGEHRRVPRARREARRSPGRRPSRPECAHHAAALVGGGPDRRRRPGPDRDRRPEGDVARTAAP